MVNEFKRCKTKLIEGGKEEQRMEEIIESDIQDKYINKFLQPIK